jgi:hypothetical protein
MLQPRRSTTMIHSSSCSCHGPLIMSPPDSPGRESRAHSDQNRGYGLKWLTYTQ